MGASQLNKNPVSTLLRTAVKEIGLRSESIDWGRGTFPKFRTSSYFHREGTHRSLIDELKIELTGWLIGGAKFFSDQFGISSGPTDLRAWIEDRKINGFRTDDVFVWDVRYGSKGEMQSQIVISNLTTVPLIKFIKFNLAEGLINCFSEGLVPENWPIHCNTRQGGGGALKDQTTIWYCPTTFWG